MNYESIQTYVPVAGSTGSWGLNMTVTPHPVSFSWARIFDVSGAHVGFASHLNPQLDAGATHSEKYVQWKGVAQRWRLAYAGVTIRQDAASMTNQGSIVACQTACEPGRKSVFPGEPTDPSSKHQLYAVAIGAHWTPSDLPDFGRVQSMPQAYHGLSKDGLYMPLRLTESSQTWHGEHDEMVNIGVTSLFGAASDEAGAANTYNAAPPISDFPFEGLACVTWQASGGTTYWNLGQTTGCICNGVVGHVCLQNLDLTTRITVTYRYGFEVQVQPGTLLTPQQRLSPKYDARALESYFSISREMSDAYPEEYNNLGKIWNVIKGVADTVLPHIPYVGQVYTGVRDGIRAISGAASARASKAVEAAGNASLADKELARKVISAPGRKLSVVRRKKAGAGRR